MGFIKSHIWIHGKLFLDECRVKLKVHALLQTGADKFIQVAIRHALGLAFTGRMRTVGLPRHITKTLLLPANIRSGWLKPSRA